MQSTMHASLNAVVEMIGGNQVQDQTDSVVQNPESAMQDPDSAMQDPESAVEDPDSAVDPDSVPRKITLVTPNAMPLLTLQSTTLAR